MSQPFDGHIDDAKIFHRTLTPAEIARLARPLTRWERFVRVLRKIGETLRDMKDGE